MNDRVRITHTVDYMLHTRRVVVDWPMGLYPMDQIVEIVHALDDAGKPTRPWAIDDDGEPRGAHVLRIS
jgi:hypothetical protein